VPAEAFAAELGQAEDLRRPAPALRRQLAAGQQAVGAQRVEMPADRGGLQAERRAELAGGAGVWPSSSSTLSRVRRSAPAGDSVWISTTPV